MKFLSRGNNKHTSQIFFFFFASEYEMPVMTSFFHLKVSTDTNQPTVIKIYSGTKEWKD